MINNLETTDLIVPCQKAFGVHLSRMPCKLDGGGPRSCQIKRYDAARRQAQLESSGTEPLQSANTFPEPLKHCA